MDLKTINPSDGTQCEFKDGPAVYSVTFSWLPNGTRHFCVKHMFGFLCSLNTENGKKAKWNAPAQQHTFYLDFMVTSSYEEAKALQGRILGLLGTTPADYAGMTGEEQTDLVDRLFRAHDTVSQGIILAMIAASAGNLIAVWHDTDGSVQYEGQGTVAAYTPVYYNRNGGASAGSVSLEILNTTAIVIPLDMAYMVGHDELLDRMRADFDEDIHWNSKEGNPHFCAYCGSKSVRHMQPPITHTEPFNDFIGDAALDKIWDILAEEHYPGCEWIATRAHSIEVSA